MNVARFFLASLAVFVFVFFYEYLLHGVYLAGPYEAFPNLLREETDATGFFMWLTLAYLILSPAFCYIFTRGYQGRGVGEGVRYGVLIWLVAALPSSLITYAVQPWSAKIITVWIVGYLIEMVILGALVALIYRPKAAAA